MILEVATLDVRPGQEAAFEAALHHFYDPFPSIEHYTMVSNGGAI